MASAPRRFKVDENLPLEVADLLATAGYETSTVHSQHLVGAPDPQLAEVCRGEDRALVTLDLDFADIQTYPPERYPGLVVLRLGRQDKSHVLEVLRRALERLTDEELRGRLWIIEEHRIRVRSRDDRSGDLS